MRQHQLQIMFLHHRGRHNMRADELSCKQDPRQQRLDEFQAQRVIGV